MVSRKLAQRTNAWLIRVDFFYTYSRVNGLCFGYFQIFPKRSPFDLKITLTPFLCVSRLSDHTVLILALFYGVSMAKKKRFLKIKSVIDFSENFCLLSF